MTDPQPERYYKIDSDIETLADLEEDFNEDGAVWSPTAHVVEDPLHDEDLDGWFSSRAAARATPDEHAEWTRAHQALREKAARTQETLAYAEALWEKAKEAAAAELREAYAAYAPTHHVMEERVEELRAAREAEGEAEMQRHAQAAREAQAAEDAELGPRTWVIRRAHDYTRRSTSARPPVVHLAGCGLTEGRENNDHERETRYARVGEVTALLAEETDQTLKAIERRLALGREKGTPQPVKLCGRCKPEPSLSAAGGEDFTRALERMESLQPPPPTARALPTALGKHATPWRDWRQQTDGYGLISRTSYESQGLIKPHELAVGWIVHEEGGSYASASHEDKLDELITRLPEAGFTGSRVKELTIGQNKEGDKLSPSLIAVRRMTPHELRQHKRRKAT